MQEKYNEERTTNEKGCYKTLYKMHKKFLLNIKLNILFILICLFTLFFRTYDVKQLLMM